MLCPWRINKTCWAAITSPMEKNGEDIYGLAGDIPEVVNSECGLGLTCSGLQNLTDCKALLEEVRVDLQPWSSFWGCTLHTVPWHEAWSMSMPAGLECKEASLFVEVGQHSWTAWHQKPHVACYMVLEGCKGQKNKSHIQNIDVEFGFPSRHYPSAISFRRCALHQCLTSLWNKAGTWTDSPEGLLLFR